MRHPTVRPVLLVFALLLGVTPAMGEGKPAPADGKAWLASSLEKLRQLRTARWFVDLEVVALPVGKDRATDLGLAVGTSRYEWRVKGASRVHWREGRAGKTLVEAWYEGSAYHLRFAREPGKLRRAPVGEGEGWCIRRCLVEGGVLGWRLTHGLEGGTGGSAYVASIAARLVGEEKAGDRTLVVIDTDLGFGFGPERARGKAGSSRLWIDRETLLPVRRETTIDFGREGEGTSIRAREAYGGWKLDEPIPDAAFHLERMPAPDRLVDAPDAPAAFEALQTRRFLGFDPKRVPPVAGRAGKRETVRFGLQPKAWSLPKKDLWAFEPDPVVATGAAGARLEAICCRHSELLAPGHPFRPTRENRRHRYGMSGYSPCDVYIGRRVEGKIVPKLFFRDVGSHDTDPFDIAIDAKGRCHLAVADVDIYQRNRMKLLWLVGDPATGKWTDAHLVEERREFTSWAHPRLVARGDTVHLLWSWNRDDERGQGPDGSGVYHLARGPEGFGPKARILSGATEKLDLAADADSGKLVAVVATRTEVLALSLSPRGVWSEPVRIEQTAASHVGMLRIDAQGGGRFLLRAEREKKREWILTCE